MDVVALGELLIDFTCLNTDEQGYPTMAAHPGGAPANFLAAVSKFGGKTALLGKVGDDAFGRQLVRTLREHGIDTKGIVVDPTVFTTLAFVTLNETGDREFSFARMPGADTRLTFEEVNLELLEEFQVKLVWVTCGGEGCYFANPIACGWEPALTGITPVVTTGAGDIFGGSAMERLLRTGQKPEELNEGQLRATARFANAAAGLSTTMLGGISSIPEPGIVERLIQSSPCEN